MEIEIWSDIVCPWCYIGKRRFETALACFPERNQVTVVWRSFELDPKAPHRHSENLNERIARKYGMSLTEAAAGSERITALATEEGLDYHLGQAQSGNTFNAHRLLHLAMTCGLQAELKERLMRAYFTEGRPISDHETLLQLAADVGIDPERARAVLAGNDYATEVRADERRAAAFGITSVPFVALAGTYGVSGAQPADVFLQALEQAWAATNATTTA